MSDECRWRLRSPDGMHGRLSSRWSAARVLAPHKGQAWPGGRHATTCRGLATPPGPPSNGDEPASRHLIQPLESPIPRLGTTAHQLSGANRRPTGHARPGPLWTARHVPRLRRPRDRPNLTRIPWTRSALIQDVTRLRPASRTERRPQPIMAGPWRCAETHADPLGPAPRLGPASPLARRPSRLWRGHAR